METTGTIRAYFLFFGCIDILMHYGTIREGHETVWISLIGLTRGILYLCVGLALPVFLSRYVWLVNSLLVAGLCFSFVNVYNRMLLDETREFPGVIGVVSRLVTSVFLTMYVLNNVKRLAAHRHRP